MLGKKMISKRYSVFVVILLLAVCFFLTGCSRKKSEDGLREIKTAEDEEDMTLPEQDDAGEEKGEDPEDEEKKSEQVYVYICGAVNIPGVYCLEKDARIFEVIQKAGGLAEKAADDAVNQARIVQDGERIYIPTVEEVQNSGTGVAGTIIEGTENKKVNINTAGMEELMTLTGIGEAKALSIIEYREEKGRFESIEELMEIEGIKEGVFNKIKEDIMI